MTIPAPQASSRARDSVMASGSPYLRFDLVLMSLVLLAIGVMSWFAINLAGTVIRKDLQIVLTSAVNSATTSFQQRSGDRKRLVENLAASLPVKDALNRFLRSTADDSLSGEAAAELEAVLGVASGKHNFSGYLVLEAGGEILAGGEELIAPDQILHWLSPDNHSHTGAGAGQFFLAGAADAGAAFVAAAPVTVDSGRGQAWIALTAAPGNELAAIASLGETGSAGGVYFFDRSGRLLAPQSKALAEASGQAASAPVTDKRRLESAGRSPYATFPASQTGDRKGLDLEGYTGLGGGEVIGAWSWLNGPGVGLAVEIDRHEAYKSYRQIRLVVLAAFGLVVIIFLGLLVRLAGTRQEALERAEQAGQANERLNMEIELRRKLEGIVQESDQYIRSVVNSIMDGVITTDSTGRIETYNPRAEKMFGYSDFELTGESLSTLAAGQFAKQLNLTFSRYSREGKAAFIGKSIEIRGRRKNGRSFPLELSVAEMKLDNISKLVVIARDITRRKRLEKKLQEQSSMDGLTRIANRRSFDSALAAEWRRSVRHGLSLGLVMLDIDFFKNYNDSLGHQAGDQCLRQVASVLKKACQRPSDLVARYGGEEFVALMPETSPRGTAHVADRIRSQVEALGLAHPASPICPVVTVSLGAVNLVPQRGQESPVLVSAANSALYEAKRSGRNRVAWAGEPGKNTSGGVDQGVPDIPR